MNNKSEEIKCTKCKSTNWVKNGPKKNGSQQYWCKDCDKYFMINKRNTTKKQLEAISLCYYGFTQVFAAFCVNRNKRTVRRWLDCFKNKHIGAPASKTTLIPINTIMDALQRIITSLCQRMQKDGPEKEKFIKQHDFAVKQIRLADYNMKHNICEVDKLRDCFKD